MTIEELKVRLEDLNNQAHEIRVTAEGEKRDLTGEEAVNLDGILAAFDRTKADIDRLDKLSNQTDILKTGKGRKTESNPPNNRNDDDDRRDLGRGVDVNPLEWVGKQNGGFRSLGDMAVHVARACRQGGFTDPRLERLASATTYGNEGSGSDGGFAVPPEFRSAIMVKIMGEDSLLSRCDQISCAGNNFTCPVDETTPWQTSGGIQATWDGEAVAATQSKPALGERTVKLNKLRALVPLTEEILEDASAMDSYLRRKAPDKINFKINYALIQGNGVGMPLGLLNAAALITVTKESGQQANTIVANNIFKMYNRMYAGSRPQAVWLYNQEIEPQLFKLSVPGTDNTGNAVTGWGGLVYMPPGGISAAPFGSLMGRPCIPTQACPALSSAGDIMFVDFAQYLALLKSGPNPKVDVSMHLWFDQDLTAFKFTLRMGGMPWWSVAASPLAGSNTYSPYVALGAR